MKKKEKRMILILVIITIIALIILVVVNQNKKKEEGQNQVENKAEEFVEVLEDGTKLNTSGKFSATRKLDGLEIGNIQLTNKDGASVVLANVTNTTNTATPLMEVTLTLLDKQGNELISLDGIIEPIPAGGTVQMSMGATADYANAYDFTIVKK